MVNLDSSWWLEWYEKASMDEKKLADKVGDFECDSYFSDMLFEEDSIVRKYIQCQVKRDDNKWDDVTMPLPDELSCFSYTMFHYKIEDSNWKYEACFDPKKQMLSFSPKYADSEIHILHEMIHMHEDVINELPQFYHDILYWALYQDLKGKIPKLDEIISSHAILLNQHNIYYHGGLHDILFILKSLDLDIRKGYQLGTIFGYGYQDDLKDYEYKKPKD